MTSLPRDFSCEIKVSQSQKHFLTSFSLSKPDIYKLYLFTYRLDLCKTVALIGFMPEDPDLSVASKDNPLTSMFGPGRLAMAALPLLSKVLPRPKLSSKTVRMALVMLVMSLKSPENIQLVLDSMINIFQDLLTRYFYCSPKIYEYLPLLIYLF